MTASTDQHSHGATACCSHDHATDDQRRWYQTSAARLVGATGAGLAVAWIISFVWPPATSGIFIAACLIGIFPIARRAYSAARARRPFTIEMLMTVAAIGALAIDAAQEAALVIFLFAIGEALENVAADRARVKIRALADLMPKTAILVEQQTTRTVEAADLEIGQIVLVRPGDRVPADGEIVTGISSIDESPVTGESMPKTRGVGEPLFAGSVNREAALHLRVTRAAADNTIARIIRLTEEAQQARAATQRLIERFSQIYMPAIVGGALLVALLPPLFFAGDWSVWIYRALALLLIGCPCALVISVPAAIAAALSAGARQGLLMKGGVILETAAKIRTIAFDKTGTLTQGTPRVTDVIALDTHERAASWQEIIRLAAAVESGSNHPLAQAVLDYAQQHDIRFTPALAATTIPGQGVTGQSLTDEGGELAIFVGAPRHVMNGAPETPAAVPHIAQLESAGKTVAAVAVNGALIGLIALSDQPRADAASALEQLKGLNIRTVMLTGDNARTAAMIAKTLDMEYRAELMPDDKVAAIEALAQAGPVMMVGDGINDAPALAAANIGMAMGSGAAVALETASGAILKNRLQDVAAMIRLARAAMGIVRANITIALGLKALFLATSVFGYTGLWVAILADTGATILVTANALRLLRFDANRERREPSSAAIMPAH